MADSGFLTAGAVSGSNGTGTSWNNATNTRLGSSDNSYTTSASSSSSQSRWLQLSNFGFSIPSGATIDGVEVEIEKSASAGSSTITDRDLKLSTEANDTNSSFSVGDNKADTSTNWSTTDTTVTYGGATDKWGLDLTPNIVNNSAFGLVFKAQRTAGSANAQVDRIQMKVYYTTGSGTSSDTGWLVSSAESNDSDSGTSWINLSNVRADDGFNASAILVSVGNSKTALLSGIGASIPSGAIIEGIEVKVRRYSSVSSSGYESICQLLINGTKAGTNKADNIILGFIPTSETEITLGGLGKTWNLLLTPADINDSDFGFAYKIGQGSLAGDVNVDYIAIKVYYYEVTSGTEVESVCNTSFNIQSYVTKSYSTSFNMQSFIEKTYSTSFNIYNYIEQIKSTSFNIFNYIEQTKVTSFNIESYIQNNINTSYNINSYVEKIYSTSYNIYNSVEQVINTSYNIQSYVENILNTSFNLQSYITNSLVTSFNILNQVEKIYQTSFNINSFVTKEHTTSFNIQGFVTKEYVTSYNISSFVEQLIQTSFNILEEVLEVESILTTSFNIQSFVSKSYSTSFNIQSYVENVCINSFNIKNYVLKQSITSFNISNYVTKTYNTSFNSLQYVEKIVQTSFKIINVKPTSLTRTLNVLPISREILVSNRKRYANIIN